MADKSSNGKVDIALIQQDVAFIRDDVAAIKLALQTNYVTKDQFLPVKRIAYGFVTFLTGIVMTAFGYIVSKGGRG
jgi:hypothetical protein